MTTALPTDMKAHFSRFLEADSARLHMAAHSHHPWPDVSFEAQRQTWLDAAELADDKWTKIFGKLIPEAQRHVADRVGLPDPNTVCFGANTHEFVVRIVSCLPRPARILTTDAEFHSFVRQAARWQEAGRAIVERVSVEPFDSFAERFAVAAGTGAHDLVFLSHVFFDSGTVVGDLEAIVAAVDADTFVVVDAYHGFMALPTDLSRLADRVFYTSGGYKYAMAGEGVGLLHCPPGYGSRPVDTGWFAGFAQLQDGVGDEVAYPSDGQRFMGATFNPGGLYRFNAVQRWLDELGVSVADIHDHVGRLQRDFLDRLRDLGVEGMSPATLVPGPDAEDRGNFLTFRTPDAGDLYAALHDRGVITDYRDDRLRVGFGCYHDTDDLDELCDRLADLA